MTAKGTEWLFEKLDELVSEFKQGSKFYERAFFKAWLQMNVPKLDSWFIDDGVNFHIYSKATFQTYEEAQNYVNHWMK